MTTELRRVRTFLFGLCVALFACAAAQSIGAKTPPPLQSAAVSVDFGAVEGRLRHSERLNNFSGANAFAAQRAGDVQYLNQQGLHGDIYRVWSVPVCDATTNTCTVPPDFDAYMKDASTVSDSVLLNLAVPGMDQKAAPAAAKSFLKMTIRFLKQKYPRLDYIEAFNEPDFAFAGSQVFQGLPPILQPNEIYPYYVPVYEAVNEVNEELKPEVPIKVGGPAFTGFNQTWITAFLDGYAADPNPRKRLDFFSYHGYGVFSDTFQYHQYRPDPSEVSTQRGVFVQWLRERHLNPNIPSFITETGVYPGPSFDDATGKTDYLRNAAGVASLHYWFNLQCHTRPFNWVVRHLTDERKDQFISRVDPVPANTFTPYGNMLLMQSRMKEVRVHAASDSLKAGLGVYALASKDRTGASVMVWNYQYINDGRYHTTLNMARIPEELRKGLVRQRLFRIDQQTSNYWWDPSEAYLQQVDEQLVTPGKDYSETVDLEANAIYLILLEPASSGPDGEHWVGPGHDVDEGHERGDERGCEIDQGDEGNPTR